MRGFDISLTERFLQAIEFDTADEALFWAYRVLKAKHGQKAPEMRDRKPARPCQPHVIFDRMMWIYRLGLITKLDFDIVSETLAEGHPPLDPARRAAWDRVMVQLQPKLSFDGICR